MRLMDEGIAYVILLFLLAEMLRRKGIPGHWAMMALFVACIYPAPVSNITAIYLGVIVLLMLFDLFDRTVALPTLNETVLLAILIAGVCSFKTTFLPPAAIFFLSFFLYQLFLLPDKGKTIARAGLCLLFIVVLLSPWMVYSRWASGTYFYPLFGKGYHGSVYGIYLLPTANMGLHNFLAFLDGLSYTVGLVLAMQIGLVLSAFRRNGDRRLIDLIVVINLLIDFVVIGIGTGGVQMYRYSFFILYAIALFLLVQELGVFAQRSTSGRQLGFTDSFAAVLLLGMLLGTGYQDFLQEMRDWRITALKFSLSGKDIVTPAEASAYRDLQLAVPPGQKILVRMDKNYLFNFRRNPIYINDLPGGASLPPGIPIFKGPEALADYLVQHGIRYLAYSYGDEATFSRALFADRLEPRVNIWIRRGAEIAFDFQDNALALGKTRKRLYDNGSMFVLDLETPASGNPTTTSQVRSRSAILTLASYSPDQAPDDWQRPSGPVVNVKPGMTTEALQKEISRAPRGATVLFAPGTYEITTAINVPCTKGLTLTGPPANPATAILSAAFVKGPILAMDRCTGVTIQFLHFENSAAVYMGKSENSGLTFVHNQVTNLQGMPGILIDGYLADAVVHGTIQNLVSNTTIEYNSFGDAGSCRAEFAVPDNDGICAGIITHAGELLNLRIKYNSFFHVSEPIHLEQLTTFQPGKTNAVCDACRIEYNYILNYHRIGIENQVSAPNNPIYVQHNVVDEPINAFWGTFAMSMACCISGFIQNGYTGYSPSLYYNDNVTISTGAGGIGHPPYGVEFWGTGAQGLKSLVEGNFSNGYTYGFGNAPWAIRDNYICGPYMVKEGGYISNQQKQAAPAMSGNIISPTCKATPSATPKISPAGGSFSGPMTVTLSTDAENTSIYYTTDGTAPVPGQGTTRYYDKPIPVDKTMTLKAVGMWGAPNQPLSYPPGYGYVPSGVVTASYVANSGAQRKGI